MINTNLLLKTFNANLLDYLNPPTQFKTFRKVQTLNEKDS